MFLRALLAVCVLTLPAVYAAGSYASGGADPTFTLDWEDDGTTITFTLSCRGTGWCSVGFNAAGGGVSTADIYMGNVVGGTPTLLDNHNHNNARPTQDGSQDCTIISSTETGGRTTIVWSRLLDTDDGTDDKIITDSNMNLFFAYQATDDNMNTEHTGTGSSTQNLLAEQTDDDGEDDTEEPLLNAFTSPDGGMGMEWTLDQLAGTITITMYCNSGWVSVGLCASTDINDKTDMWTGWMPAAGTTPMLLDTNSHNQVVPPQDTTNNLQIISGTNANIDGKTQIVFSRPLAPTDTADIAITDTSLVVVWAWSNQDGTSATNYPEHGSRGFVSINFFTGEVTEIVLDEIDPAVVLTGFIVGCVGVFVVGRWSYKGYKKWNHAKAKGELGPLSLKAGGPIVTARKMTTRDDRGMSSFYRGNTAVEYKKNPWEEATDPNTGATYYYNQDTGESVWTKPAELTSIVVAAQPKKEAKTSGGHEWEECVDPNSGLSYFYNKRNGCSQWEKPKTDVIDLASDSQDDGGDHHRPLPPPAKSAALKQKQQVWGLLDYRIPYTQVSVLYAIIGVVYFIFNIIFLIYVGRYIVATNWGYLAMANSLFLALPANRNGVLVWLLGLSFDRVIIFHRWLGRWTVFCVSMHMFTYWDIWTNGPVGMGVQFSVVKYHYGWWAWFFGMIVMVTSLEWFRRKHFEWFFYSHFFFFLFYAFGALHTPKYEPYLIAALFFYILDRLIRVFWGLWPCKSISFEVMEGNLIKIRFPKHPVAKMLGLYGVGQYMFINFPGLSLLEWHPFSVANGPREQTMAVYIKGLGDHTTKLIERARSSQDAWMWMRVDGPYGNHRANYRRYPVLLLFGGGVGITPIMGILKDMFNVGDLPAGEQPPPHCVDAVYMMWTMTDEVVFNWFTQELTACQQQAGRNGFPALHLACYVTRAKNVTNPILNTGRPDVAAVFDQVARDHPNKAVTVFACGPAAMVNSAWDKANTMELSGNRFDFHHETFEF